VSRQIDPRLTRALVPAVVLLALLVAVPVPFVAIGRGPTYDTLGKINGVDVVQVKDLPTYPTSGHLNMTTVGVRSRITGGQALQLWLAGDEQVLPRSAVFPPGVSDQEAVARTVEEFVQSQGAAEAAALSYLNIPTTVVIGDVLPGGPGAGVLAPGDVVVALAGRAVTTPNELRTIVSDLVPGQPLTLTVDHPGQPRHDVALTVGTNPQTGRGFLGVVPLARPAEQEVVFTLGDVGGPSAGLMFALAVVDKLTPGELTGGRFVAGTGQIDATGTVQPIEGIRLKMLAAREAGATAFLVPSENCTEARSDTPEGLQTIRVDDLGGAVAALDALRSGGTPPSC